MQRLLPFAFKELLPRNVHEAIAGISAFFRDLCARSVTLEGIENLKTNIAMIQCNLEKIFPPSFFDVMEHLVIHLARELELGGPVQYRWMYLYERYMFHLKKMVENLSRVEGSIVAQMINEEISNFAEYYFPAEVQTKNRRPARHDDRGERATYHVTVPDIFTDVGRLSGKSKDRRLTEQERSHLQTYLLTNCEDVLQYERIFMAEKRFEYRYATEAELEEMKQREFAGWMFTYVSAGLARGETFDDWIREMVVGPNYVVKSYPRFCTRGYAFTTEKTKRSRTIHGLLLPDSTREAEFRGVLSWKTHYNQSHPVT
ncbi:uncharacterized protein LOC130501611 [Raphanus sativus]|uniref:Uncharacterized protein LOC130501611 n=1 Tax=Raphanus sativus TaxID=3726 RepID=A0A9W3CLV4_RAPSA|nr:uncharacterized protein LOC130501611 [Raphanus sativus]